MCKGTLIIDRTKGKLKLLGNASEQLCQLHCFSVITSPYFTSQVDFLLSFSMLQEENGNLCVCLGC